LAGINVSIPQCAITVITGVSGSGKSSLAFDTLFAEGQRRYVETFSAQSRQFLPQFDKPPVESISNLLPAIAISQRAGQHREPTVLADIAGVSDYLRLLFAQSASAICPTCQTPVVAFDPDSLWESLIKTQVGEETIVAFVVPTNDRPWPAVVGDLRTAGYIRLEIAGRTMRTDDASTLDAAPTGEVRVLLTKLRLEDSTRAKFIEAVQTAFEEAAGRVDLRIGQQWRPVFDRLTCPSCLRSFPQPHPSLFQTSRPESACSDCKGTGQNQVGNICPTCHGQRLGHDALAFQIAGETIGDLLARQVDDAQAFVESLLEVASSNAFVLRTIRHRLAYLHQVGLGYLTLDRPARTLSTGECRRAALTTALGSNLAKTLFVLDEPTAGLHPADTQALLSAIHALRDADNTIVLVEHDHDVISQADWIIDLGPGAGRDGGRLLFQGTPHQLWEADTPTARALRDRPALHASPRQPRDHLHLDRVTTHNLQSVSLSVPLGLLVAVAGPSGAGKSAFVMDSLVPALQARLKGNSMLPATVAEMKGGSSIEEVVVMDDQSLARTDRGNSATYLGFFSDIRDLMAATADAKVAGLAPADFSFNRPGGRCETCHGAGYLDVDMSFLPDIRMTCPDCAGQRYQARLLSIKYRGLHIAQLLNLSVREAFSFFRGETKILRKLKVLKDVGLDYLPLGQPLATLSGGEAQRLKIAYYLSSRSAKRTLFVLEEPTTGLHDADIRTLVTCLRALIDVGHSVLTIEHNLRFLAQCDHLIELGPGAGPAGGRILAQGTPSQLALLDTPTGRTLAHWHAHSSR
jgi:excinuclease ABC subunit A